MKKKKSIVEICAILAIAIAVTAAGCLSNEQKEELNESFPEYRGAGYYVYDSISNWMVYHFHDTSPTAPMR